MCYSGKCKFENWLGNCTISNHKAFIENYKHSPCLIGGWCSDQEEEAWADNNRNIVKSVIRRYYADKEEERKSWR